MKALMTVLDVALTMVLLGLLLGVVNAAPPEAATADLTIPVVTQGVSVYHSAVDRHGDHIGPQYAFVNCPICRMSATWTGKTQIIDTQIWYIMKCPRSHTFLSKTSMMCWVPKMPLPAGAIIDAPVDKPYKPVMTDEHISEAVAKMNAAIGFTPK